MNIEDFIDKIVENCETRKLEKYQISYSGSETESLSVFEQKINESSSSNEMILSFSALVNGKLGRFSTNKFDEKDINMIVKNAIINAETISIEEEMFMHDGSGNYIETTPYSPLVNQLENLDKVQYLKTLEKTAYDYDKRIDKVVYCEYNYAKSYIIMRNSLGLNLKKESTSASAVLYLSAKDEKNTKTAYDFVTFDKKEDFSPETLANKTAKETIERLNPIDIKSKKSEVIFKNTCFASLLSNIEQIFSSYIIDRGFSKLKGQLNKEIASSKLSIIDNPHLNFGFASTSFDGEGVATFSKPIIENGVFKNILYNLAMGNKYKTKSTGNGTGGLGTRTFNLYVEKGNISKEDLLKKLGNGVYIDKLSGIHAGIEIVSGDFSLGAEGFLIEDGKITKPLNQFTISGNIYTMLKDITEIADNLEFKGSRIGCPDISINNITIANE